MNYGALKPSSAKTMYDGMKVPGGRTVGETPDTELTRMLVKLNIPNASHENGRAANVEHYAAFVQNLRRKAGDDAEAAWLATNGSAA